MGFFKSARITTEQQQDLTGEVRETASKLRTDALNKHPNAQRDANATAKSLDKLADDIDPSQPKR